MHYTLYFKTLLYILYSMQYTLCPVLYTKLCCSGHSILHSTFHTTRSAYCSLQFTLHCKLHCTLQCTVEVWTILGVCGWVLYKYKKQGTWHLLYITVECTILQQSTRQIDSIELLFITDKLDFTIGKKKILLHISAIFCDTTAP